MCKEINIERLNIYLGHVKVFMW